MHVARLLLHDADMISAQVFIPLGDDFRWVTPQEISWQYDNYKKLFDYVRQTTAPCIYHLTPDQINSHPKDFKATAKFSTLNDYFESVFDEQKKHPERKYASIGSLVLSSY